MSSCPNKHLILCAVCVQKHLLFGIPHILCYLIAFYAAYITNIGMQWWTWGAKGAKVPRRWDTLAWRLPWYTPPTQALFASFPPCNRPAWSSSRGLFWGAAPSKSQEEVRATWKAQSSSRELFYGTLRVTEETSTSWNSAVPSCAHPPPSRGATFRN